MRCARPRLIARHSSPLSTRGTRSRGNGLSLLPSIPELPPLVSKVMPCCMKIASRRLPASISPAGPRRLSSWTSAFAVGRGVPSGANSSSRNGLCGRYPPTAAVSRPELTAEVSRPRRAFTFDGWTNRGPPRCSAVASCSVGPAPVPVEVLARGVLAVALAIAADARADEPVEQVDRQAGADDARSALEVGFAAEHHQREAGERDDGRKYVAQAHEQPAGVRGVHDHILFP